MPTYLIHYSSEIGLKGHNRRDFINQLRRNVRRQHPAVTAVEHLMGRLVAENPRAEDFSDVFGVAWWAEVTVVPAEVEAMTAAALFLRTSDSPSRSSIMFAIKIPYFTSFSF